MCNSGSPIHYECKVIGKAKFLTTLISPPPGAGAQAKGIQQHLIMADDNMTPLGNAGVLLG